MKILALATLAALLWLALRRKPETKYAVLARRVREAENAEAGRRLREYPAGGEGGWG